MRPVHLVVLAVLLLTACGDDNNHGFGYHYDFETASEMRVRYEPGTLEARSHRTPAELDRAYRETAECIGLPIRRGGFLIIVKPEQLPAGVGGWAFESGTLLIDMNDLILESMWLESGHPWQSTLRHEFIHLLIMKFDHKHPGFRYCVTSYPQ